LLKALFGLYVTLTAAAILRLPGPVSPVDIFLSQLDNTYYNPNGVVFGLFFLVWILLVSLKLHQWFSR
jgi:hypothetical protein